MDMQSCNGSVLPESVGTSSALFTLLIQTLLKFQCSISPPEMWPKDYGPTATDEGLNTHFQ